MFSPIGVIGLLCGGKRISEALRENHKGCPLRSEVTSDVKFPLAASINEHTTYTTKGSISDKCEFIPKRTVKLSLIILQCLREGEVTIGFEQLRPKEI